MALSSYPQNEHVSIEYNPKFGSGISVHRTPGNHILGAPLFDLSSVSIHLKGVERFSRLYGHVRLIDENGEEFTFFHRLKDDPQTVVDRGPNSAFLEKSQLYRPCLLPASFLLKVFLKDICSHSVIANQQSYLDFSRQVCFDSEQELILDEGVASVVTVRYTIFQFALIASVEYRVFDAKGSATAIPALSDSTCEIGVAGRISTSVQVRNGQEISHVLFDTDREKIGLVVGAPNILSVLAVPSYSMFRIKLSLKLDINDSSSTYSEQIVTDDLFFRPEHRVYVPVTKIVLGKRWRVLIDVTWRHVFAELDCDEYPERVFNKLDSKRHTMKGTEEESEESSFAVLQEKTLKLPLNQQVPSDELSRGKRELPLFPSWKYGRELMEVFSIFVESKVRCASRIRKNFGGMIRCYDSRKHYLIKGKQITNRNLKCVPLLEPSFKGRTTSFGMFFNLEDDKDTKIIGGNLNWNWHCASGLRDRRLCSVVPGDGWFAAAYYIIYSHAVAAKLKVFLVSYNECDIEVQGKICASCSTYKYSNFYEKKYYQSILFEKGGGGVHIGGRHGSNGIEIPLVIEVPLSKDQVAVPLSASLIVGFNLRVLASGRWHKLNGEVDFNPIGSLKVSEAMAFERPDYCLSVRVEWG